MRDYTKTKTNFRNKFQAFITKWSESLNRYSYETMCGRNGIVLDVFTGGCCISCTGRNSWASLNVGNGQCIKDSSVPCKTATTLPWHQCEVIWTLSIPSNKTGRIYGSRNVCSLDVIELLVSCRPTGAAYAGKTVQFSRINISFTRELRFTKIETRPKADRNSYCFVTQTKATRRYWQGE